MHSPSALQCLLVKYSRAALFFCEYQKRCVVQEGFRETVDVGLDIKAHALALEQGMVARFGMDVAQRMPLFQIGLWFRRAALRVTCHRSRDGCCI